MVTTPGAEQKTIHNVQQLWLLSICPVDGDTTTKSICKRRLPSECRQVPSCPMASGMNDQVVALQEAPGGDHICSEARADTRPKKLKSGPGHTDPWQTPARTTNRSPAKAAYVKTQAGHATLDMQYYNFVYRRETHTKRS